MSYTASTDYSSQDSHDSSTENSVSNSQSDFESDTENSLFSEAQENEGVEPYQYEPSESDNDETDEATSTTDGSSDESSDEDIARLTSISWLVKFLIKQYIHIFTGVSVGNAYPCQQCQNASVVVK